MKTRLPPPEANDPALAPARQAALIVYVLHALASATLITFFVAIFINYSRYDRVNGTIYESHFRWQIHTFWYCCVYSLVGVGINRVHCCVVATCQKASSRNGTISA